MAVKPTDEGAAYTAAKSARAKVAKGKAAPVKKASMPARSNKGGAVRGQARAAQVHAMNASKRGTPKKAPATRVTPEAKRVYMTMTGVPKQGGLTPTSAGSFRGSARSGGLTPTSMPSARAKVNPPAPLPSRPATVKTATLGSSARKPPSQVKRPQ